MSTQDEGKDLGDQFAEAAKPRGTMSIHQDEPDDASMSEAFRENTEELGRGENPLAQGDEDGEDEEEDAEGHAGVFSPGRTDQPD